MLKNKPQRPWQKWEELVLMEMYGSSTMTEIAFRLDRSVVSVRNKALNLGVSDDRFPVSSGAKVIHSTCKVEDVPKCPSMWELWELLQGSIPRQELRVTSRTLGADEKRKVVKELQKEGKSTREIAEIMGCSHTWAIQLAKT